MRRETQTEEKQRRVRRDHPGLGGLEHPTVEPPGARGHPAAAYPARRPAGGLYTPWRTQSL